MKRIVPVLALVLGLGLGLFAVQATPQLTEWSAPVNLGPVVNSTTMDQCVSVSKNGLSLYFSSNRSGSMGGRDLWVTQRASVSDPWGVPQLVLNVNSTSDESCPSLSLDEHRLYFVSARPGGCGGADFYVSRRHNRTDDFGWEPPVNLGCAAAGYVNTPEHEGTPNFFEDETGTVVMYFSRGANNNGYDIYESRMSADDTFGPGTLVAELTSPYPDGDLGPAVRRDGLEVIFGSTRPGGLSSGYWDLWMATRNSTSQPWSAPVNLTILNSTAHEFGKMCFSFDGRAFYFASNRPGGSGATDLYVATREKLPPPQ